MLSILYATCHAYKSLWTPFLKLKNKYIDSDIPTYICTDVLDDTEISGENVHVLSYGKKSNMSLHGNFYDRYLDHIKHIHTEYILFFVDDMFPLAPVSREDLHDCIELMKEEDAIKIIKLSTHSYPFSGPVVSYKGKEFVKADNKKDSYIMNVQPILIKRDFLIEILNYCKIHNTMGHQNGGLEVHGTEFFRKNDVTCLRVCRDIVTINYAGGIVQSGFISEDTQKLLLNKEDIIIETFGNNLIFKLTEDEYTLAGDALREDFARRGIAPEHQNTGNN
jgi:hypothetical protein